ncbi:MAG: hypothetical protein R3F31_12210 [Verrucomicrobiales bacterium]
MEEHELVDLQDEADLRCWQFVDLVNLLRAHQWGVPESGRAPQIAHRYLKEKPDKTAPEAVLTVSPPPGGI